MKHSFLPLSYFLNRIWCHEYSKQKSLKKKIHSNTKIPIIMNSSENSLKAKGFPSLLYFHGGKEMLLATGNTTIQQYYFGQFLVL